MLEFLRSYRALSLLASLVLVVLIVAFLTDRLQPNPNMVLKTIDLPVTDLQYPSLSPDGTWIAFLGGSRRSKFDIYRSDIATGKTTRLTFDSIDVFSSETRISPDGELIAYSRPNPTSEVCIVPARGGPVRVIAKRAVNGGWMRRSGRVGIVRTQRRPDGRSKILSSILPDGTDERVEYADTLTSGFYESFDFSPDERRLAWIRAFGEDYCELFVVDLETKTERQLTFDRQFIDMVAWATNDQLVFSTRRSGHNNLWLIPASGGTPAQMTRGDGPDLGPSFSDDGERMIYNIRRSSSAVWMGSLETGKSDEILADFRPVYWVAISPDGESLAISTADEELSKHRYLLHTNLRSGESSILATNTQTLRNLNFSPDGKLISFATRPWGFPTPESLTIRVVGVDTVSNPERVIGRGSPSLWLDNKTIIVSVRERTFLLDVYTRSATPFRGDSMFAVPVPKTNFVMYNDARRSHRGYWYGTGDGRNDRLRLPLPVPPGSSFRTMSGRQGIVMWNQEGKVWRIDARTGSRRETPGYFPYLTSESVVNISYDGNTFVYTKPGQSMKIVLVDHPFAPPWWRSTWAAGMYGLVMIVTLALFRRYERGRDRMKFQLRLEQLEAEKLREVGRMKSQFFANISHEFRTPLTLIRGPIEQLWKGTFRGDRTEIYEMVVRNTDRLLRLVTQLLDLSKLDAGERRLTPKEGDVSEVIRTVAASFESLAARRGIAFDVTIQPEKIRGVFDTDVIEKVVTNLLSNAFKFTPDEGGIYVDVRESRIENREWCEVTVADTGVGIPQDALSKVFDRFYQVDQSQTREQEGTGIGLALTKELVELHGGSIAVESEEGRGSRFTVKIPVDGKWKMENGKWGSGGETEGESSRQYAVGSREKAKGSRQSTVDSRQTETKMSQALSAKREDLESKRLPLSASRLALRASQSDLASSDEASPVEMSSENPVVLVIEDNKDMRRYIRQQLEEQYRVIEAENGKVGLEKAQSKLPDLIVSDVMMPKMDGFEVCRRVKMDQKTSHIPVILLTAKAGDGHKLEGLETGADDYLVKPFDARELRVRLRNLHDQRRRMRESYQRELVVKPTGVKVTSMDERFLKAVFETIESRMSDGKLNPDLLAKATNMSRMNLHRKLKSLTGYSAGELIRNFRLERAKELLAKQVGTISEIAFQVGFNNPSNFSKSFSKKFGKRPSDLPSSA